MWQMRVWLPANKFIITWSFNVTEQKIARERGRKPEWNSNSKRCINKGKKRKYFKEFRKLLNRKRSKYIFVVFTVYILNVISFAPRNWVLCYAGFWDVQKRDGCVEMHVRRNYITIQKKKQSRKIIRSSCKRETSEKESIWQQLY